MFTPRGKKEGSDRPNASRSRTAAYGHTHTVYSKLRRRAITYTSTHPLGYVLFVSLSCLFFVFGACACMQASKQQAIYWTPSIANRMDQSTHVTLLPIFVRRYSILLKYNKERPCLARLVDPFAPPVTPVLRQLGSL
jgi:hypothetical protein